MKLLLKTMAVATLGLSLSSARADRAEAPAAPAAAEPSAQEAELADIAAILNQDIDVGLRRLMELEGLLNRSVESASKKTEQVFDSPLSATVLTREEIIRSGARTIPEALRLVPGLIVREQTSGNYDIHIRGFDNIPPKASLKDSSNTTTLVMIDYRVVYSYFQGGTFWDTLPVDLHDIERIEIVRGPTAAIHGPNAVTGAINIITRRPKDEGFTGSGTVQYTPLQNQRVANGFVGYKRGAWSGTVSANHQRFDRLGQGYWSFSQGRYLEDPADIVMSNDSAHRLDGPEIRFPDRELALERLGANAMVGYAPSEDLEVTVQAGLQDSTSQKVFFDGRRTPLATYKSTSGYAQLHGRYHDGSARLGFTLGDQATPLLPEDPKRPQGNPNAYAFNVLDAQLDYRLQLFEPGTPEKAAPGAGDAPAWSGLELRPAVSYRRAFGSGPVIASTDAQGRVLDPDRVLQSLAGAVLGESTFFGRLKLVAALRLEHYFDRTEPKYYPVELHGLSVAKEGKQNYPAFEVGTTFKVNDDHLLRAVYSRAHRAPFFFDSYAFDEPVTFMFLRGNRALDLLTSDMAELGYRARLSKNWQADLEVFGAYTRNYYLPFIHVADPLRGEFLYQYDNIDLKAFQYGGTASVGFQMERLNASLFATVQQTKYTDYVEKLTRFIEWSFEDPMAGLETTAGIHKGTPRVYGGGTINLQPLDRLEVNASLYAYSAHTLQRNDVSKGLINPVYSEAKYEVKPKAILNAMVSYRLIDQVAVYLNARNILDLQRQEYAWTDPVPAVVMAGTTVEY